MVRYKHKPTGKTFLKAEDFIDNKDKYYEEPYQGLPLPTFLIPAFIVENGRDWEKIEEILFTTEDGVGLKKGNIGYGVRTKFKNWEISDISIQKEGELGSDFGWKWFSSIEKRIEYMEWNEPKFSLKQIWEQLVFVAGQRTADIAISQLKKVINEHFSF